MDARLVQDLLKRKALRQSLGLPELPATGGKTSWAEIMALLRKRKPFSPQIWQKAGKTLKEKKVDLKAAIPIREEKATVDNVVEILQRNELREVINLPPTRRSSIVSSVPWLDMLSRAVSIKEVPEADRLIMGDFVDYFNMRGDEISSGHPRVVVSLYKKRFAGKLKGFGKYLGRLIGRVNPCNRHLDLEILVRPLRSILKPEQIGRIVWAAVEDQPERDTLVTTIGILLYPFGPYREKNAVLFREFLGPAKAATQKDGEEK